MTLEGQQGTSYLGPFLKENKENITILTLLKVHKNENFFGFDFEICTFSQIVRHKYEGFVKKFFGLGHHCGRYDFSAQSQTKGNTFDKMTKILAQSETKRN